MDSSAPQTLQDYFANDTDEVHFDEASTVSPSLKNASNLLDLLQKDFYWIGLLQKDFY